MFGFDADETSILTLEQIDAHGFTLTPMINCEQLPAALDVTPPEGYAGPAIVTSDGLPAVLLAPNLVGVPALEISPLRPPRAVFDVYGIESWTDRGRTVPYAGADPPRDALVLAGGPDGTISFVWPCGEIEQAPRYGLWLAAGLIIAAAMRRK